MPGIIAPFILFTLLYGLLALVVLWTIWRHIAATEHLRSQTESRHAPLPGAGKGGAG